MSILALGLVLMLGVHVFASLRPPRDRVVARIGVDPYRGSTRWSRWSAWC